MRIALEALHIDLVDGLGAGGARREPAVLGDNLETTDGGIVARRLGQLGDDGLTRQSGGFYQCRIQLGEHRFLGTVGRGVDTAIAGAAEPGFQCIVVSLRILAGHRQNFRRQQRQNETILVGGPDGTIFAQEGGARALLATKAKLAAVEAIHEPLEADRYLFEGAANLTGNPVNHGRRYQRLANGCIGRPAGAVGKQILDCHRQVVVRVHQAGLGNDTVTVVVRVVAKGDVELVLESDQARHGERAGTVHPDLAVFIQGHEGEGRVDLVVHHLDVQVIGLGDDVPVGDAGSPQRIDTDLDARVLDGIHIQHVLQIIHIGGDIVVLDHERALERLGERHPLHTGQTRFQNGVGAILHPLGDLPFGGTTVGRVVLEATVFRRVVGRGDHHTVSAGSRLAGPFFARVVAQDGMRDDRGRGEAEASLNASFNTVGRQHFDGAGKGGFGQGVGIHTDKQRARDAGLLAILHQGLGHRQDVGFGKGVVQGAATVAGGTEGNPLLGAAHVGLVEVVGTDQTGDVGQVA